MKPAAGIAALALVAVWSTVAAQPPAQLPVVQVYKSPTCGCCTKWIDHLRQHGFTVNATDLPDVSEIKKRHTVPGAVSSCHTALVDGYIVEGHVPAPDVVRLLEIRSKVIGLAVPRMPIGSPGMEGANPERYDVVSFDKQGNVAVFSSHGPSTRSR